jgi:hypothetical protein
VPFEHDRVLKFDYRGAPQTVGVLRRAALESQDKMSVREFCEDTCGGLDSKDYLSEYLAIYYALLQRTRYMRDPRTVELVKAPYIIAEQMLRGGRPSIDCDDYSGFIAACVLAMGGTPRLCTVAFRDMFYEGRRQYSHVFCEAFEPRSNQWIVLDPVAAERTKQMLRDVRAIKVWSVGS